jgi:hypothetical protein
MSRPTIFGKKTVRLTAASVTSDGAKQFEAARKRLAKLVGWPVDRVSDGDVTEALARGWDATERYLKGPNAALTAGGKKEK